MAEYEPRYECVSDTPARDIATIWPRIREALMVALTPFKEAREAVIRALEQAEAAEAPS